MGLKEILFKHAETTSEFSKGTERQRGDKKIREREQRKKKKWGENKQQNTEGS